MDLHKFQEQANRLLFLYYNAIGIIQRDYHMSDIEKTMERLSAEIKECKASLLALLEGNEEYERILEDYEAVLVDGNNFVNDGLYLVDRIVENKPSRH